MKKLIDRFFCSDGVFCGLMLALFIVMFQEPAQIEWQAYGAFLGFWGAYHVGSSQITYRIRGFRCFLASNGFLIAWSFSIGAYWITALQIAFCWTSWRGLRNAEEDLKVKALWIDVTSPE